MTAQHAVTKPKVGMILAIKAGAPEPLAGIPGTVIEIWPRFPSGDYLVTLEYAKPVKANNTVVRQVGVFLSELERAEPSRRHSRGEPERLAVFQQGVAIIAQPTSRQHPHPNNA